EHPDIHTHPQMELGYFLDDNEYEKGEGFLFDKYFPDWSNKYMNLTAETQRYRGKKLRASAPPRQIKKNHIIAKNAGLYEKEQYIKRLYDHNPECKIVFIIRNPVERSFSAYLMEKNAGFNEFPFSDLKKVIEKKKADKQDWRYRQFVGMSMYAERIKWLNNYFGKENVQVFTFDQLKKEPVSICKEVFNLLGVDKEYSINTEKKHNVSGEVRSKAYSRLLSKLSQKDNPVKILAKSLIPKKTAPKVLNLLNSLNKKEGKKEAMDEETASFLRNYFREDIEETERVTGFDLSGWKW
ncbi:MAG: sulfotransferase domain-containing protein, partial [Flavobacteriales bacterium]